MTTDFPQSSSDSVRFQVDSSPIVEVSSAALSRIDALAQASKEHETGGILVGFNVGRNITILEASDAGPKAQHSPIRFQRDTEYCRQFLAQSFAQNRSDYVGEWHSHVAAPGRLSLGDLGTVARIFIDPDYDFVSFVLLLAVVRKRDSQLLVYVAERDKAQCNRLQITLLHRGRFPEKGSPAI